MISGWVAEVEAERGDAERDLARSLPRDKLTGEQIRQIVLPVQDGLRKLATASPAAKQLLYRAFGLTLTYHPETGSATVEVEPWAAARANERCAQERVGGAIGTLSTRPVIRGELAPAA